MPPLEYLLGEDVSGGGEGLLGNRLNVRRLALWSCWVVFPLQLWSEPALPADV